MKTTTRLVLLSLLLIVTVQARAWQTTAPESDVLALIRSFEVKDCSILEVSKEMFEILAADTRNDEELKQTISQINHLIYLNCFAAYSGKERETVNIAEKFREEANLNNFKLLMRSETSLSTNLFYRRKNGDNNEYILVTEIGIQYISTKLNIISIRELKDIIDMAGSAGDL